MMYCDNTVQHEIKYVNGSPTPPNLLTTYNYTAYSNPTGVVLVVYSPQVQPDVPEFLG